MKRSTAREIAMHFSFELAYSDRSAEEIIQRRFSDAYFPSLSAEDALYAEKPSEKQMEYIVRVVEGVDAHGAELDSYIAKYAKGWNFSRISRTAAAIMRVCMFEVLYMDEIPDSASINEAVELAKKYEEKETVAFINGVLGSFARGEKGQ